MWIENLCWADGHLQGDAADAVTGLEVAKKLSGYDISFLGDTSVSGEM